MHRTTDHRRTALAVDASAGVLVPVSRAGMEEAALYIRGNPAAAVPMAYQCLGFESFQRLEKKAAGVLQTQHR